MASPSILRQLVLLYLTSTYIPSTTALAMAHAVTQPAHVFDVRSSTCPDSTYTACSLTDPRLPGNMCCPAQSTCISLDSGTTALCCPMTNNSTCTAIQPLVDCSVSTQDANTNPTAQIFTTRLNDKMRSCGNTCCPFGYTCNNDTNNLTCLLDIATSSYAPGFNSSSSPSSSAKASPTTGSSVTPVGSSSSKTSGIDSTTPQPAAQPGQITASAVAVGFFPGMIVGGLLALALILLCGRRRRTGSRPPSDAGLETKSHLRGHDISAPIPMEAASTRSDFIRRTTMKAKSILRSPKSNGGASPYDEGNWKMPTPPVVSNIPSEAAISIMPVTPERQRRDDRDGLRKASTESIKVYSPPSGMTLPSRPIVPVRGMSAQRGPAIDSAIGSPFKTPPNRDNTYHDATTMKHGETLSPTRYDGGGSREDKSQAADISSRPTTTFTEMLRGIDFPDPLGSVKGNNAAPPMPPIPRGLSARGKERKW